MVAEVFENSLEEGFVLLVGLEFLVDEFLVFLVLALGGLGGLFE